jgi:hypothetical protein
MEAGTVVDHKYTKYLWLFKVPYLTWARHMSIDVAVTLSRYGWGLG